MNHRIVCSLFWALSIVGCFSADDFSEQAPDDRPGAGGNCALDGFCEPEMGEVRICLMSQCGPPFDSDGVQPEIPTEALSGAVPFEDVAPRIRIDSSYLDMIIRSVPAGQIMETGQSILSIYATEVVIEGTPTSDSPTATRVLSVDPDLLDIIEIKAKKVWIRHGTVFESLRPEKNVTFAIKGIEGLYADDDVVTNGVGACPCINTGQADTSIKYVGNTFDTGHNCPNAPSCAIFDPGG